MILSVALLGYVNMIFLFTCNFDSILVRVSVIEYDKGGVRERSRRKKDSKGIDDRTWDIGGMRRRRGGGGKRVEIEIEMEVQEG